MFFRIKHTRKPQHNGKCNEKRELWKSDRKTLRREFLRLFKTKRMLEFQRKCILVDFDLPENISISSKT